VNPLLFRCSTYVYLVNPLLVKCEIKAFIKKSEIKPIRLLHMSYASSFLFLKLSKGVSYYLFQRRGETIGHRYNIYMLYLDNLSSDIQCLIGKTNDAWLWHKQVTIKDQVH
jgi:hypothetical protein